MNTALVTTCTCPCTPGKVFKALSTHKKTKKHLAWEQKTTEQKIQETKSDNEILRLNTRIKDLKEDLEELAVEKNSLKTQLMEAQQKVQDYERNFEMLTNKIVKLELKNKKLKSTCSQPFSNSSSTYDDSHTISYATLGV